jgi:hypothetical protein
MKTLVLRILFTAVALMGLPSSGLAVPVLWTLIGVGFDDGGTASGSFVYDADTNSYSSVNIMTTGGKSMQGSTYAFAYGDQGYSPGVLYALTAPSDTDLNGLPAFSLVFSSALTNTSGGGQAFIGLQGGSLEFTCLTANCSLGVAPSRNVSVGAVTGIALSPIVYTIVVPGALIGTITTDGTIGSLGRVNIIAWNLTATVANPLGGTPLTFYFNSATPSTGNQVVCGDGGCGVASAGSLTFPGASMLELGFVDPNEISFSSGGVTVSSNGNPGMPVTGPVTLGNQPSPDLNQHGLTGSWYEPVKSGQGFEFEVYPSTGTGLAFLSWFTFDTVAGGEDSQRWYTAQGPVVTGQPNASLTIYQNTDGNFNAPPATAANGVGTVILSLFTCTDAHISYSFSDGTGRTGNIALSRLLPNVTCSTTTPYSTNADFALSGNWFDSAIMGQGFTIEVNPNLMNPSAGAVFAAWYTYAPMGAGAGAAGQRWYTAQSTQSFTAGMRSIPVSIYETTGGIFNTPTPAGQHTVAVGTGTLAFQSCTAATFNYNFTGGSSSSLSGTINLSRVGPVPPGCISP